MELGLYSFAETHTDPATGEQVDPGTRLKHLLEEIELADRLGLDVYGVGEHHRPDFAVSAPAVVLAAAAARTKRIRLSSAVSVISSDDPVRVFQEFSTVDLISDGRAEIMAGYLRSTSLVAEPHNMPPGYFSVPDAARMMLGTGRPMVTTKDGKKVDAMKGDLEDLVRAGVMFVGTPDDIVDQLKEFDERLGVDGLDLGLRVAVAAQHGVVARHGACNLRPIRVIQRDR